MLPLMYRDFETYQSPYFFKRFKDRKTQIGYTHHFDLLKDFLESFKEPSKSVLMKDVREGIRYCDTFCIFKNSAGIYITITLKETGGYFEVVNVLPSNLWQKEIFDNKDDIRKEIKRI
ncbi:MAG: hypothetical protein AABW47_01990 [Nanoarchaeota archaeon]